MKRILPVLERLRIRKPCPMKWEDMTGDASRRFCAVCNKHVHDLGSMTLEEGQALVTSGRACVRVRRSAMLPAGAAMAAAGVAFALSAACSGAAPDEPTTVGAPPDIAQQPAVEDGEIDGGEPVHMLGDVMIDEPAVN